MMISVLSVGVAVRAGAPIRVRKEGGCWVVIFGVGGGGGGLVSERLLVGRLGVCGGSEGFLVIMLDEKGEDVDAGYP